MAFNTDKTNDYGDKSNKGDIILSILIVVSIIAISFIIVKGLQTSSIQAQKEVKTKIEQLPVPTPAQETDAAADSLLPEDVPKYHDALARALHIDQTCYDTTTDLWFVHTPGTKEAEGEDGTSWAEGWYVERTDKVKVIPVGNKTYSVTDISDIFNLATFPDVKGLDCKTHVVKD